MQLRWLVTRYPYPTIGEIRNFAEQNACSLQSARNSLVKRDKKELQILSPVFDGWDTSAGEEWVTIPTVIVEGECNS